MSDQRWYPKDDEGRPVCPVCTRPAGRVQVIAQSEVGSSRTGKGGVVSQDYRFFPCEHEVHLDQPASA